MTIVDQASWWSLMSLILLYLAAREYGPGIRLMVMAQVLSLLLLSFNFDLPLVLY
jgi:hypothetical protein